MKSKELKTHNLPVDVFPISKIDAKPDWLFIVFIMLGIFSFTFDVSPFYGATLVLTSLCVLLFMPKVHLMEFFQEYLVMFNKADKNSCVLIYYDEISSWYYTWSANRDYLYIELENGTTEKIEAFSKTLFEANMNRFARGKKKTIK
ncbi:MAG: hypothetical protein IJL85_06745 [Erysipelotrichaceae bacterium]|nr:hypothetical protein [Erysipelotrichaceae bacterium]